MASLKEIRTRIDSTKNTQQITKAMKMVSAAKLKKAQDNIINVRPYAHKILNIIADIAATHRVEHPLLCDKTAPKKVLRVVLTSDRGLCGGFNANIIRFTERQHKADKANYEVLDYLFIGKKAADYFKSRYTDLTPVDVLVNMVKDVNYSYARAVADRLINYFLDEKYDEIQLVYNEFKSALEQKVVTEKLLPVDLTKTSSAQSGQTGGFSEDMIFEPSPETIIEELLKKHFAGQVYRCMSESIAGEHGARMTAMENATKNAQDLMSKLTLTYNKLRQASITTELIEITSGAEALKG